MVRVEMTLSAAIDTAGHQPQAWLVPRRSVQTDGNLRVSVSPDALPSTPDDVPQVVQALHCPRRPAVSIRVLGDHEGATIVSAAGLWFEAPRKVGQSFGRRHASRRISGCPNDSPLTFPGILILCSNKWRLSACLVAVRVPCLPQPLLPSPYYADLFFWSVANLMIILSHHRP